MYLYPYMYFWGLILWSNILLLVMCRVSVGILQMERPLVKDIVSNKHPNLDAELVFL